MKIGDKLYCHNNISDYSTIDIDITIDNFYIIKEINTKDYLDICIVDDNNSEDWYSSVTDNDETWYYKNFFYTEKEQRKLKIEKLYESNL